MSILDEDRPRKPSTHELGCDLSALSAEELQWRIELLRVEITRLENDRTEKLSGRAAAENLFRPRS